LKLKYYEALSNCAFKTNLRHYNKEWFQASADQGDPMAALHLGKMYATGRLGRALQIERAWNTY
jgi:TPR repeat protein